MLFLELQFLIFFLGKNIFCMLICMFIIISVVFASSLVFVQWYVPMAQPIFSIATDVVFTIV